MKEPIVYFKRYTTTHPSAMLSGDTYFEITKIEGAVFFEVTKEENSKNSEEKDRKTVEDAIAIMNEEVIRLEAKGGKINGNNIENFKHHLQKQNIWNKKTFLKVQILYRGCVLSFIPAL